MHGLHVDDSVRDVRLARRTLEEAYGSGAACDWILNRVGDRMNKKARAIANNRFQRRDSSTGAPQARHFTMRSRALHTARAALNCGVRSTFVWRIFIAPLPRCVLRRRFRSNEISNFLGCTPTASQRKGDVFTNQTSGRSRTARSEFWR